MVPEKEPEINNFRNFFLIIFFIVFFSTTSSGASRKTLKVGIYENEPKVFTSKGNPSGFWVDLLNSISLKEDWNIQWVHGTWDECLHRLEEGQIDIMPDVAYTEERNKTYSFQKETVFTSWARVYVSKNSKIQSFTDLDNKKIAVLKGSVNYVGKDGIKELTEKFSINCSFVEVQNYDSVFRLIEREEVDAGVANKNFGNKKESEYKVKRTAILFQPADLRFAFPKKNSTNTSVISHIDYHISQFKQDENSIYYYLIEKYFEGHIKEKIVAPSWIKIVMCSITLIILFLLAVSVVSRYQIKRKTAELKESERKLKEAQKMAHVGNWYWDVKTGEVEWSEEVYRIFRLDQKKFTPQIDSILELSPWTEDHARDKELIQKAMKSRKPGSYEQRFLRPDKSIGYYFSTFQGVYNDDGELIAIKGTVQDITERKKAEEEKEKINAQLLQAQKMESVGRLAGTIAHDFNNLLTAIIGYGHLLYDKMEKEDPKSQMMEEILNAAKRAAGLTSQLLAFSRKTPLKLEVLDLNSLITGIVEMVDRIIGEDIVFSSNLEEGQINIKGDATQIEQIILNLIVNARDAMPEGGKIAVKTEKVSIRDEDTIKSPYEKKGDFICLSVTDTGKGINKETISKIFDPFYTTKKTGTGLGLSVVKEIIKKQKGWINVESKVGKGASFKIYFPACHEKKIIKNKGLFDLSDLQGKGETVLVLEDEKITRKFITKVLKGNGYTVLQAASIEEASEYMKKKGKEIQMLFSDVVLSDGSGLQFAEEYIKKNQNLKVILSSGYTNEKAELSSIAKKKFKFLEKPYEVQDLLKKVKKTFS